ncbi:protein kinase domain-containing protein [Aporhodopirellula aestuarii]|uniref:Protein kinase n=1 Tax=Aporhodopirellula aestuarii TaxID=2950107 RepID=A0ABT0UDJ3_9BACT|nr:protein kinase [Aporhodopirellula aestuarii]MCM2374954.1 protein kinase [Aporhodopirellula aestuarii]
MSTDQTINLQHASAPLRTISVGHDGEALVGASPQGGFYELRVLSSASAIRCRQLREQLTRVELLDHPQVRRIVEISEDSTPPSYKLGIPHQVDPFADRLSLQLDSLTDNARLTIAASIVDASIAAHRIGVYHGSFNSSTILVSHANDDLQVWIDFTGAACSEGVTIEDLSVETDLRCLRQLLSELIGSVVEGNTNQAANALTARSRVILRQWLKPVDAGEPLVPTLGQWQQLLEPFAEQRSSMDQTGVISPLKAPAASSSTSRVYPGRPSAKESAEPPVQIGRFRIGEQIGEGGMGTVYRATDSASGEIVAVKVLRNTGKDIAQAVRRFRKEARLLADVQNDHIIKLVEVGEDDGLHFLAMEFINGIDLKSWLSSKDGLPEADALRLAADMARGLDEAHAREIVHRDVKPENVLLKLKEETPASDLALVDRSIHDFTVKLTDFGIARHVNQSESMEMTRAGSIMGTPKYMSPEQCNSTDAIGPTADVYSLGITLFEMLTGTVPFDSDDFMKLAAMHCFDEPPAVQKRNATITDGAAQIVTRCLAKNPEDRFGDAGQFLKEILRLLRGDAAEMDAHPKLPAGHDVAKRWDKTVTWQLESSPAELWPLVSNTERLNEAIGLPAVEYRTEKDPQFGIRKFGSFTLSGVRVAWEEHPFEWVEGKRMGILREFSSGPFKWFLSVVTMTPRSVGGTELSHRVQIEPRNLLGRVLTKVEADWKGFRNLEKVYARMDRSLRGRLEKRYGSDPFEEVRPLSRNQALRLNQRMDRVMETGVEPQIADALTTVLQEWSPQELAKLRPLAIAHRTGTDGAKMTDACLVAAKEGVLNLQWDVLCPTCRVSASSSDKLSQIQAHTHCEACDVNFKSNLANAIEMVFQAHPEIRDINESKYCIGGPEHSPHVIAQIRVDVAESVNVTVDLGVGDYLIRGPRLSKTQTVRIQSTSAPSSLDFTLSQLGAGPHTPKLRAGRQILTFTNDLPSLHVVRLERMIVRDDVVTAAMASANPLFRQLFPNQSFAVSNPVETEMMTFLATCINDVDELYASMGEAQAYSAINDHHALLSVVVAGCGGTVVKTIGEKMLAVFAVREDAVTAAVRIRRSIQDSGHQPIQLGLGIHSGATLVTTQNNQLDYFGSTVRAVFAIPELASGDTLITEAVYTDPSVADQLREISNQVEQLDLPGSPATRIKRI